MTQRTANTKNGVNVDQLVETIELIEQQPKLAKARFRAETDWVGGARSRTKIQSFYAAGQEDDSRERPFVLEGDEPPVLLGDNRAPNAVEAVLHALASCLAVGFTYNAAAQGIDVQSLHFRIEGDLDLQSFLGLSDAKRPGYENIEVTYRVESDAPQEKILELCRHVQETSPVLDILRNPTNVSVKLAS